MPVQNSAKLIISLVLAVVAASPTLAQDAVRGKETYLRYCATCHGTDARGGGPTGAVLTLRPTDLTRLSTTNDGSFPTIRVVKRIDGREPLVSHGSPMPMYGEFFEGRDVAMKAPNGMPILTSQPVVDLVVWLESIQD
jgi:mono/diheme cytochrome c family protein